MSRLVALDVGTSSLKAVLYDRDQGIVASADADYGPEPAPHRQNADAWWRAARDAVRKLDVTDVEAVVLSGAMENLILRDSEGTPLHSVLLYSNPCGQAYYDAMIRDLHDVVPIIGNVPEPLMTAFKWRWFCDIAPGVVPRVRMIMAGTKDDLLFRMTGRAVTDPVTASTTGLMNIVTRDWSVEMMDHFGLQRDLLPEILDPSALVGTLRADAANHLGLRSGIPVMNGCGDAGASTLGSFCDEAGDVALYLGQSGWMSRTIHIDDFVEERAVYRIAHPRRDALIEVTPLNTVGVTLDWMQRVSGKSLDDIETELRAADIGPPHALFLPHAADGQVREDLAEFGSSFLGLDLHHSVGDMFYAALEGLSFSMRSHVDAIDPIGPGHVAMIGTGAASQVWPQVLADCMARPVSVISNPDLSTALGVCRIAASVLGWPRTETIARTLIEPRLERADRTERRYDAFLRAIDLAQAFSPLILD